MSKNSYAANMQQRKDGNRDGNAAAGGGGGGSGARGQKPLPHIRDQRGHASPKIDDSDWLRERLVALERKSQQQEDQITVLNTALADVIRRVNNSEGASANTKVLERQVYQQEDRIDVLNTAVADLTRRLADIESPIPSFYEHEARPAPRATNNHVVHNHVQQAATVEPVKAAPKRTRNHNKARSESPETPPSPEKDSQEDKNFDEDEGYLRMYLRGRPVYMYATSDVVHSYDPDDVLPEPSEEIDLEWVYGYRGRDCRSNLYLLKSGEVLYFMAAIGVMYNIDSHTQRHYRGHNDDIKCLALHPDLVTVATGQMAGHDADEGDPHVRVWNSRTLETISVIGLGFFGRAVTCVGFSKIACKLGEEYDGGSLVCAVDDSNDHVLSVWDWKKKRKVTQINSSGDPVLAAEFHPTESNRIMTCGKSALFTWKMEKNGRQTVLDKTQGIFGKTERPKWVLCMAFTEHGDIWTGDSNGNIIIWEIEGDTLKVADVMTGAHNSNIFSLCVMKDGSILSGGGKDHKIIQWDKELQRTGAQVETDPAYGGIRTMIFGKGNSIIIGTTKNMLLKGSMSVKEFTPVMAGHMGELWGLAVHPNRQLFITCGYDGQVILWDPKKHSNIWIKDIDMQAHCASFHPNGTVVAIGTSDCMLVLMDVGDGQIKSKHTVGNEQIECLAYSPDGKQLALGSRDNRIYIFSVGKDYKKKGVCSGHTSYITHIDWSADSDVLQSNSGDYELLYWDPVKCKQLTRSSHLRDVEWFTQTCTLGFTVRGIWPDDADGTDVNTCGRSKSWTGDHQLVATGDDSGRVNMYQYPCIQPTSECKSYKGHSSHVTSVMFMGAKDDRILSTGGQDNSIIQWKVTA